MEDQKENRIEDLARQKLDGKSYNEIRSGLKESGLSQTEISKLIRQVDERVLEQELVGSKTDRANQIYGAGLALAIVGLLISIVFNIGILPVRLPALAAYTPFICGILLMFYGKLQKRKQMDVQPKGPGPIRRRRPFK